MGSVLVFIFFLLVQCQQTTVCWLCFLFVSPMVIQLIWLLTRKVLGDWTWFGGGTDYLKCHYGIKGKGDATNYPPIVTGALGTFAT